MSPAKIASVEYVRVGTTWVRKRSEVGDLGRHVSASSTDEFLLCVWKKDRFLKLAVLALFKFGFRLKRVVLFKICLICS
jgi:hypothetical protein